MWFSLFVVVLILTITFFQGLQGLFSALIMCVLTILSAALAFGLYEDLYFWQLIQYQPAHGRAIALMAIFILALLVLRTVFDLLIKGNLRFPAYVDRAGGGVLGFVTAMIIVGMLSIGIQMLPFGLSFMGFSRYAIVDETGKEIEPSGPEKEQRMFWANLDWSKVKHSRRSLLLAPGTFTVGLMGNLSRNALHGRSALTDVYPDLLRSLYNARSGHFRESRMAVGTDAITVEGYWDMPPGMFYTRQLVKADPSGTKMFELKPDKEAPPAGMKRVVVRVRISDDARDEDNFHRFTTEQFRLVGREGRDGPVREFFLVGVNHEQFDRWVRLHRGEGVTRQPQGGPLRVDLVFEVPDRAEFMPLFVEYKQNARAEVRPPDEKAKKQPIKPLPPTKSKEEKKTKKGPRPQEEEQQPGAGAGKPLQDRVSGLGPARKESEFKNELPFALTQYGSLEVANGKVRGGHVVATLSNDWEPPAGNEPAVEAFEVPADKRMLQLSVEKLQPQSWLGNIYGGMVDAISDFYLIDANDQKHMPVGHYAMAVVGGKPTFELRYLDEGERGFARLPKFEKIKGRDLQGDYCYYFLFHVPPGCKPVKMHTGRTDVDLKDLNLVAPE